MKLTPCAHRRREGSAISRKQPASSYQDICNQMSIKAKMRSDRERMRMPTLELLTCSLAFQQDPQSPYTRLIDSIQGLIIRRGEASRGQSPSHISLDSKSRTQSLFTHNKCRGCDLHILAPELLPLPCLYDAKEMGGGGALGKWSNKLTIFHNYILIIHPWEMGRNQTLVKTEDTDFWPMSILSNSIRV